MAHDEMTITDVLRDPLIRQLMRADGVTVRDMKRLLRDAASKVHHRRDPKGKAPQATDP